MDSRRAAVFVCQAADYVMLSTDKTMHVTMRPLQAWCCYVERFFFFFFFFAFLVLRMSGCAVGGANATDARFLGGDLF